MKKSMVYSTWCRWSQAILWTHILSLIGIGCVYGFITVVRGVPFNDIFLFPDSAPYYLTVYLFVIVFAFTLCAVGLILGDIFGHKDLRAQIISRGMLMIGILASLLPLSLISIWNKVLSSPDEPLWVAIANAVQYFGIWLTFVLVILFALLMLLLFYMGREQSQIPNGWAMLCIILAVVGMPIAISCFWIPEKVIVFRIFYLIGSVGYLIWGIWLAKLIRKIDHML